MISLKHSLKTSLLIVCVTGFSAAPSWADSEGDVAIQYLKNLATDQLDLSKETAISKNCSSQRRKQITQNVKNYALHNLNSNDHYTVQEVKKQGDLAAVIIREENSNNPLEIQFHTIALTHKNDGDSKTWQAAPLIGSFSSSGYGYDEMVEQAANLLEQWMQSQKKQFTKHYNKELLLEFTTELETTAKEAGLENLSREEAVSKFIEHCRNKDTNKVLTALGVLSNAFDQSVKPTLKVVLKGLNSDDAKNKSPWPNLTSRDVISHQVKDNSKNKTTSIGFYNPMADKPISIISFTAKSIDSNMFVQLPYGLSYITNNRSMKIKPSITPAEYKKFSDQLVSSILESQPKTSFQTAQEAHNCFLSAYKAADFSQCIKLAIREGDFDNNFFKEPKALSLTFDNLGHLWKKLRNITPDSISFGELIMSDNLALAPVIFNTSDNLETYETTYIWYFQVADGWRMFDNVTLLAMKNEAISKTASKLILKYSTLQEDQQNRHNEEKLSKITQTKLPLSNVAAQDPATVEFIHSFRTKLRQVNNLGIFENSTTVLGEPSLENIKDIQHSIKGATHDTDDDQCLGNSISGGWQGVSLKTTSKNNKSHDFPLYLVIETPLGLKSVIDIDLRFETNKGRAILNKKTWQLINQHLPPESKAHIKKLFTEHNKLCQAEIDKEEDIED